MYNFSIINELHITAEIFIITTLDPAVIGRKGQILFRTVVPDDDKYKQNLLTIFSLL